MFKVAVSSLGISPFLYYELTYRELDLMLKGHIEKRNNDIEYDAIAVRIAIINGLKGTDYKVFGKEEKVNEIDPVVKEQELNDLKNLFS